MKIAIRSLFIFVIFALLAACTSTPPAPTPTAEPPATPIELSTEVPPTLAAMPTAEPTATIVELVKSDVFNIRVGQYVMDTAGFHGIDESLNATKKIETSYPSTVGRVKKVVAQITWPKELDEPAQAFVKSLDVLAAALEADNAEDAAKAATTVHETQHELSHAIDEWIPTSTPTSISSVFDIRVIQYFMDTAGFHDIDENLNETKKIETVYPATVSRVRKVVTQITWPKELDEPAQAFVKSLDALTTALEADNAEDAAKAATTIHETQHELSRAIDEWAAIPMQTAALNDKFDISVAQYLMDTAGFHSIDESLNATKKIEISYPATVSRVKKVAAQITWPGELATQAQAFVKSLDALTTALEADNAEDAAKAATSVHETQHELSHAIDGWIGGQDAHDH